MAYSQGLFMKVYNLLTQIANVTSDSMCVYLKLFSVTDANQQRLFRSKPNIRWALNQNVLDFSQGNFGGDSNVVKNLEDNKK